LELKQKFQKYNKTMKNEPNTSPTPKVKVTMDFPEAMRKVIEGKRVRRESWPQGEEAFVENTFLKIQKNGTHNWTINDGDLNAEDWVISTAN